MINRNAFKRSGAIVATLLVMVVAVWSMTSPAARPSAANAQTPGQAPAKPAAPFAPPRLAVTAEDVDLEQSGVVFAKARQPVDAAAMLGALGLGPSAPHGWVAREDDPEDDRQAARFLVAFRKPIELGSVSSIGSPRGLMFLKEAAPYPGDPNNPEQWEGVKAPTPQSGGFVATLPPGVKTRAVMLLQRGGRGDQRRSYIGALRLWQARFHNQVPVCVAYADSEWTQLSPFGPPNIHSAMALVGAWNKWRNIGPNEKGRVLRPALSDVDPSWIMFVWDQPRRLSGLWFDGNATKYKIRVFTGDDSVHPRVGSEREWRTLRDAKIVRGWGDWVWFEPTTTRGVMIRIEGSEGESPQVAIMNAVHALTDLGPEGQVPAAAPPPAKPPVSIPYEVTVPDATVTLAIDRPDGTRLRNVIARQPRSVGKHEEPWDLKDENGRVVEPGTYNWKLIQAPPLKLKYEMTVYPNVSANAPERAPWLTNAEGPDGWMADHTGPSAICAAGTNVFMGSRVSESGVSFQATDLNGTRQWAISSFSAFTGVSWLASDGKTVFAAASAHNTAKEWGVDPRSEAIWAVDVATHRHGRLAVISPTAKREVGLTSLAARDGKVYCAISASENFLANAMLAADVDIENCVPKYSAVRKEKYAFEIVPNPRADFLRLFRLMGTVPGYGGIGLTYLPTTRGKGPRQHMVVTFNQPVPIGSVVLPVPKDGKTDFTLSVLKPDAPYPPNPGDAKQWIPFESSGNAAWDVALAPHNTMTRALRVSFIKGEDDMFTEDDAASEFNDKDALKKGMTSGKEPKKSSVAGDAGEAGDWGGSLEGMRILRRRFANISPKAKIRTSSGRVVGDGSWNAGRDKPITAGDPGIYCMEWEAAQKIRGLAIKEIDGERTEIDAYSGPAEPGKPIDFSVGAEGWQRIAGYTQHRRDLHSGNESYNGGARYLDGVVDFGKSVETRAVRLRIVKAFTDTGDNELGDRVDRYKHSIDPCRCIVYGVAALTHLEGEPPVDPLAFNRIEVRQQPDGKVVKEYAVDRPRSIAFDPQGRIIALSAGKVVRIDEDGKITPIPTPDLKSPGPLAVDRSGNIYIYDASVQQVRVYDPEGKPLRLVGNPGGHKAGPWDPAKMDSVCALAVDQTDQLWVAQDRYWPKTIVMFGPDGAMRREFIGPTEYGGGGVIDPWDKSRFYVGPLEFAVDWEKGTSKLKNLTVDPSQGGNAGEVPIVIDGRRYLVNRPRFLNMPVARVYLYEKDHARAVAAMGNASRFDDLQEPALFAALGSPDLTKFRFTWCDANGDGKIQAAEVKLTPVAEGRDVNLTRFNRNLSIQSGDVRWEVKSFTADGTPQYEERTVLATAQGSYRLDNGLTYAWSGGGFDAGLDDKGKAMWVRAVEQHGVHGYIKAAPYSPEQIVSQYGFVGHETAPGDLGEFVAISCNTGVWHIMTADGLLAGRIFIDQRDPAAYHWRFPEHQRGFPLDNLSLGQEHFWGYLCKTVADGKFYAVAGHNHASIVEVQGLDKFKRLSGSVVVADADIAKTALWDRGRQRESGFRRAPIINAFRVGGAPSINGKLDGWPEWPSASIPGTADFWIGFDDVTLFLAYRVTGQGPMLNTGEQIDRLFKTGAAVDLQIGVKPDAPEDRKTPVEGDLRLLMTWAKEKPVAVLYRAVVPGTPQEKTWQVVSPVASASFDQVGPLEGVRMTRGETERGDGYIVEAAIPIKALGLTPADGLRLRMDWGFLATDRTGNQVLRRIYWSNKATGIVADAPSEAILQPDLWGHVIFRNKSSREPEDVPLTGPGQNDATQKLLKEFNDELDEGPVRK
ncbi:MAG: hypothetical protein NTW19_16815 [Planctomycetota bacterium]|nr:hypothetical protein [Planctomycetota bacterium]